jgi:hypothetical protein
MNIAEVTKTRDAAVNRIRCILSDRDSDSVRLATAHIETIMVLQRRLNKLRHEYYSGAELVAEYEALIAGYTKDLKNLLTCGARIKKLLRMIRETNKLDKKHKIQVRKKMNEAHLTSARATDLRLFIRGYEAEIKRVRLIPRTFEAQEEALLRGIAAEERRWDTYVENRRDGGLLLGELHECVDQLGKILEDMRGDDTVRRMQALAEQIRGLEAEMAEPAEGTEATSLEPSEWDRVRADARADYREEREDALLERAEHNEEAQS